MATMFPDEVTQFTTVGEEAVYKFLRQAARPDAAFLVWYSPDIEDREPDFILLSPDCGLIVFEVKDWLADQLIEITPKDALLRIGGREERRKQPLAQAREYVNSLMMLLGRTAPSMPDGKKQLPCPVTWGAIFPHISRADFKASHLDEVMDADRVLCWDDLNEYSPLLRDVSGQKLRQWLTEHFPPLFPFALSPEHLKWLRGCIFPVVRLELPRRNGASAQSETVMVLDQEQENLARTFGPGRHLIYGPAGSGRTLILAHQAWNLPRVDKRIKRILITCFNLSLVGYIRRLLSRKGVCLGPDGVEVLPFYSLCERILREPLVHAETTDFYKLVVQETLDRLDGTHPLQGHWDAILVDEGQDFSQEMAQVILKILPAHGTLTVALDENQRLYADTTNGWQIVEGAKCHHLKCQYRNTKQIAQYAAQILGGNVSEISFSGADGPEPKTIHSADGQSLVQDVANAVADLVRQDIPMNEIAILYTRSKIDGVDNLPEALVEAIEARGALARWSARDTASKRSYDITTDSVTVSTIHSVKGLDYAHIFLLGMDKLNMSSERDRKLAYVGITRARETLTLASCV